MVTTESTNAFDADLDLDSRFRWAAESLRQLRDANPELRNVFDIGSGNEMLADRIRAMGYAYTSFDIVPPSESVKQWDIEQPFPYAGSADVVLMLEIVEHLNNPWLGLKNVAAVLEPGGYLLMSTPNPSWSGSRLATIARGAPAMFTEDDLDRNHHVFTPWVHVIRRLLTDNALTSIQVVQLGKPTSVTAFPFLGLKLPARVGFRLLKKLIEQIDRRAVGALYGVIAQRQRA
jgi:SAM-dependent methyltransferase